MISGKKQQKFVAVAKFLFFVCVKFDDTCGVWGSTSGGW